MKPVIQNKAVEERP